MRRRRWLFALLIVLLIAVPVLEVWLLIQVGQAIGVLPTVGILIAEAILGARLLRHEGRRAWQALNGAFENGRLPADELTDAALVLVGGVLLILPGFATDVIGLMFLLPFTRPLARRLLSFFVARRVERLRRAALDYDIPDYGIPGSSDPHSEVIEGEVVEESEARPVRGELPR